MSRFRVDLERLDQTISRIEAFDSSVDDVITTVEHHLEDLSGTWTGNAAQAQTDAPTTSGPAAPSRCDRHSKIYALPGESHDNYSGAVDSNLRMWRLS